MSQYTFVDLFAGCGGLSEGFHVGGYHGLAHVEWWKPAADTLRRRLEQHQAGLGNRVFGDDVQKLASNLGESSRLNEMLSAVGANSNVDLVIGGPPCQAYSIAGRIRDEFGMSLDYRNYLFESYLDVVNALRPKICVFENVPGLLSATPDGVSIAERVALAFRAAGYELLTPLQRTLVKMEEYGVPQRRHRLILIALRSDITPNPTELLEDFYARILPSLREKSVTVGEVLGHLPAPLTSPDPQYPNHQLRFRSERDRQIFELLAEDAQSANPRYKDSESLRCLYTQVTGRDASVHKYHVLRRERISNLIPAHLKKDGLRHIHYDPKQARTISVLEAALLQGFPSDYPFAGSTGDCYQMIGNAVPPAFAAKLATAIRTLLMRITQ